MKLRVGDMAFSPYFSCNIEIVSIMSDHDWYFKLPDGRVHKAQTPLSYFEARSQEKS